jgi:hypothetical protein
VAGAATPAPAGRHDRSRGGRSQARPHRHAGMRSRRHRGRQLPTTDGVEFGVLGVAAGRKRPPRLPVPRRGACLPSRSATSWIASPPSHHCRGFRSYAPSCRELWQRAAVLTNKFPGGAKPCDLPIEQPTMWLLLPRRGYRERSRRGRRATARAHPLADRPDDRATPDVTCWSRAAGGPVPRLKSGRGKGSAAAASASPSSSWSRLWI